MPHMKFMIAGGLIIGAISYLMFSGISDSMVYYYTVAEAMNKAPELLRKGIRVSGYVSPDSIRRQTGQSKVEFVIFEKKSDRTLSVAYQGIIPDTFKDGAEVVVEGVYHPEEQLFHATTLLAKCPSKYEGIEEDPRRKVN